jgi:hypothetical protein
MGGYEVGKDNLGERSKAGKMGGYNEGCVEDVRVLGFRINTRE